jgi:uncharacterized membrane protein YhaH (DUF805 family)
MKYFIDVLNKYAVFTGRARRKEYWMFVLFYTILSIVLGILLFTIEKRTGISLKWVTWVFGLFFFLPSLGVSIRRLHDTGRTGWWLFISIIPFIGAIIIFIFLILDSTPGDNQYGPNPKGIQSNNPPTPKTQPTTSQFVKYDNPSTPSTPTPPQPEQTTNTQ